MDDLTWELVRDATSGRWHYEIADAATGACILRTPRCASAGAAVAAAIGAVKRLRLRYGNTRLWGAPLALDEVA